MTLGRRIRSYGIGLPLREEDRKRTANLAAGAHHAVSRALTASVGFSNPDARTSAKISHLASLLG